MTGGLGIGDGHSVPLELRACASPPPNRCEAAIRARFGSGQ